MDEQSADAQCPSAAGLGALLDGLPLIAAGRMRDEAGQELTLARIAAWLASAAAPMPFLVELARRLLALGHPGGAYPDEDPLLCPQHTRIDPDCADAPLAFARAVTAIELQNAGLLAVVVGRHLEARAGEAVLPWLGPLLEDMAAQCLLVGALAGGDRYERKPLFRRLVAAYEECRQRDGAAPSDWPVGPLTACCALGLLLRRPREVSLLAEFKTHVESWPGWHDEDAWPTRHPGADLADLEARLTELAAAALGVAERKPWPRAVLAPLVESCWRPLLSFTFPLAPRAPEDGSTSSPPTPRGDRHEPHA